MARLKTLPESVRNKLALAERLVALRSELYGDRGGPEMARRLGIPIRTWYNYETGVTVPAEIILNVIKMTAVEAEWLLDGKGPKFRQVRAEPGETRALKMTVSALLRSFLHLLEDEDTSAPRRDSAFESPKLADGSPDAADATTTLRDRFTAQNGEGADVPAAVNDPRPSQSRRQLLAAQRDNRRT